MRSGLRFAIAVSTAGLTLVPAATFAQSVPDSTSNAPAQDIVGPRELQNFSLPSTATKPTQQPPSAPASTARLGNSIEAAPAESPAPAPTPVHRSVEARRTAPPPASAPTFQPPAASTRLTPAPVSAPALPPSSTISALDRPAAPSEDAAPGHKFSMLPWFAAAIALAGGTLFLLWRRRPRETPVNGPKFDAFASPEPVPPTPPRASTPEPVASAPTRRASSENGLVAARLRPSLEISVQPRRCLIEDGQVTIEFDIDLFNAGTAPARAVLAEAGFLNAGAAQEQQLAMFFANPVGEGQRIDSIGPMKRVTLSSQVVAPRSVIQEYELAGRKAFVPVIAFNALYEWSGGKGQSSLAYLVGRETRTDKLGPLRLDNGSRDVRGLGARPLPVGVRT
jgi:hypothetical protein